MVAPQWMYGNPEIVIESLEIREKNCTVCVHGERAFNQAVCTNNLKFPQCKQRKNGFKLDEAGHGRTQ